jgi:hypothetical protein
MTCSFDGAEGRSLAWIGVEQIRRGPVDPVFNNFGGEERLWFGPEGSQFGLHFGRAEQKLSNYYVQPAMSSIPYELACTSSAGDYAILKCRAQLENAAGTQFEIDIERTIRIQDSCPYILACDTHVDFVGFQTENRITNVSSRPINRETGVLAAWTLGQYVNGCRCAVVVPVRVGSDAAMGEPIRLEYVAGVCSDGCLPPKRVRVHNEYALINADGNHRLKVGFAARRATNRMGSLDLDTEELNINDFDFYPEYSYVAPYWRHLSPEEMYDGEASSVYCDGPDQTGGPRGAFYELEALSPALVLKPGESFVHRNRVYHLRSNRACVDSILMRFLGASVEGIEAFLGKSP